MSEKINLSQLTNEHFYKCDSWIVLEDSLQEEEDVSLEPAIKTPDGLIGATNGEVWCFCKAIFSNGDEHIGSALCRGDSDDGPLVCSVWNGKEDVPIFVPPAPEFVLEKDGPDIFCGKFGKQIQDVFPIIVEVIPCFENKPNTRRVMIYSDGRKE